MKIPSGSVVQQTHGLDSDRGRFLIVEKQTDEDEQLSTICYSLTPRYECTIRTDWLDVIGMSYLVLPMKFNPEK